MADTPHRSSATAAAIEQLEHTGLAVEMVDAEWRLIWISTEMRALLGGADDGAVGIGEHYLASRALPALRAVVTPEMERAWTERFGPFMAHETPGGKAALAKMVETVDEKWRHKVEALEPQVPPPIFTATFEVTLGAGPPARVSYVMARLRDEDGSVVGSVILYTSPLPATVLALVARGDPAMFGRMAELVEPNRRVAAIMFADLEASGALSRRLPSASYFRLLSSITTAVDEEVGKRLGLVGRHAGDGVTAFFLADQVGSESGAARAAIDAGRAVSRVALEVAQRLADEGVQLEPTDCRLNVGIHWGGGLYIGQVVTGGRLEVTALGDEVNECARIEQTASEGQVLASKPVIEHLSSADADALQIDHDSLSYRTLADIEGASKKALRDAGAISVTDLRL